ncbi:MAG TPA: DUF917 family protein, partial [Propionibacteriaceae bacterium]|nr:DUF917 family protein [Propionibacteriaceae bacterium]
VTLSDPGELSRDATVAVCAVVGAPGAPDQFVSPDHYSESLVRLADEAARQGFGQVAAVVTNENGGLSTVNGWLQAASLGLPLLDCPCNGRAHPTGVMGSLGLHREPAYASIAGFAGGAPERYLDGVLVGRLQTTAKAVRDVSVAVGGMVAVARNPVALGFLVDNGAPGGISQAIEVGEAHRSGGVSAVAELLGGTVVASGPVTGLRIEQLGGFDVGGLTVDGVRLTFVNEYMSADRGDEPLGAFPDLIMTFASDGSPLPSAHLREGQEVQVLVAPAAALKLSSTMSMPELMEPVHALLKGELPTSG